jgi:hypothetical protein
MKAVFLFGWMLLIGAFLAAALEGVALVYGGGYGPLVPARELWHTAFPADYVIFRNWVEGLSPTLWDPVMTTLLLPPAWALLGVPGVILAWRFRPNRDLRADQREELERRRESLFLVDELSRAAKSDDTFRDDEDDRLPRHFVVEEVYDPDQLEELDAIDGHFPSPDEALAALDLEPEDDAETGPDVIRPVFGTIPPPGQVIVEHDETDAGEPHQPDDPGVGPDEEGKR